jgi:hypothetical protein
MASTGLLAGVNPYRGGNVAVDFTSKPLQVYLQMQQKQQAKAEAIDKYYKDYEKTLNSAGLTPEEQKIFTDKLNEVKGFAIKNKEKLTNPSKYGYDTQATVDAGFRELSNYLGGAKQAAGERKAFKTIHDKAIAEGKNVSPNYLDIWGNAMKPYGAGYVAPAIDQIKIYDSFDPVKFGQKLDTLLKRTEGVATKEFLPGSKIEYQWVTPKEINKDEAKSLAYSELNDDGYVDYLSNIQKDPVFAQALAKVYQDNTGKKLDINNLGELSYANVLSQAPLIKDRSIPELTESEKTRLALLRQNKNEEGEYSPQVQVDEIFEAGKDDKIEINVEGKNIKGRRVQLPADIEGKFDRKVGNTKFSPDYFLMSEDKLNIYPVFVTGKTKYGSDIVGGEGGTKLNEKIPVKTSLIPALGKAYGGQSWTKNNLFSDGKRPTTAPPKSETWAERQARLKKKK